MSVFMRGSSFYLKARQDGRQVPRSLKTTDKTEAMARAARLLKALKQPIDTASDTNLFGEPSSRRVLSDTRVILPPCIRI